MTCIPEASMSQSAMVRGPGRPLSCLCSGPGTFGAYGLGSFVEELSAALVGGVSSWSKASCRARHAGLEARIRELFRLHDLNGNGTLEEDELVQLNAKVALLHYGHDVDMQAVKDKYRKLFREKLDSDGRAVSFAVFRRYLLEVLDGVDSDPSAQEMIAEQFTIEAQAARQVFHLPSFHSFSDAQYLATISPPARWSDASPVARFGANGSPLVGLETTPDEWPCDIGVSHEESESPFMSGIAMESDWGGRTVLVQEVVDEPSKPRQPPMASRLASSRATLAGPGRATSCMPSAMCWQ